tara:strand:- start:3759 stop:3989 length:231 start_codon:yes stop_codon:yes gene_type:complete
MNKEILNLEAAAAAYVAERYKRKRKPRLQKDKPLTARLYLAGQALAGLLASSQGRARVSDIRYEAFEWADKMLEED